MKVCLHGCKKCGIGLRETLRPCVVCGYNGTQPYFGPPLPKTDKEKGAAIMKLIFDSSRGSTYA